MERREPRCSTSEPTCRTILPERSPTPLLVTVGHLVARKRHADVIEALALLPPEVRYRIIGDGPERAASSRSRGSAASTIVSSSPVSLTRSRRSAAPARAGCS